MATIGYKNVTMLTMPRTFFVKSDSLAKSDGSTFYSLFVGSTVFETGIIGTLFYVFVKTEVVLFV